MNLKRGNQVFTPSQISLLLLLEADLRKAEPGPVARHWTTITPEKALTITVQGLERRQLIRTKYPPKGRKEHAAQLTPMGIGYAVEFFQEAIEDGHVYIAAFAGAGDYKSYTLPGDFFLSKSAALIGCIADYRAAQATGRRRAHNSLYHYDIARYSVDSNADAKLEIVVPATTIAKEARYREETDAGLYDRVTLRWRAGQLIKQAAVEITAIRADGHAPTFEADALTPSGQATGQKYKLPLEDIYSQRVTQRFTIKVDEAGQSRHFHEETDQE